MTSNEKQLLDLILQIKTHAEAQAVLKALLTPAEYEDLSQRWQIIKGLIEGNSQRAISENQGVAIATVTRGSRELKHGTGILQKFYERLQKK